MKKILFISILMITQFITALAQKKDSLFETYNKNWSENDEIGGNMLPRTGWGLMYTEESGIMSKFREDPEKNSMPHFHFGDGIGFQVFSTDNWTKNWTENWTWKNYFSSDAMRYFIPIFLETKYFFKEMPALKKYENIYKEERSLFMYLQMGYSVGATNIGNGMDFTWGGFFISPGVGFKSNADGKDGGYSFNIGYKLQQFKTYDYSTLETKQVWGGFLVLNVGLYFIHKMPED